MPRLRLPALVLLALLPAAVAAGEADEQAPMPAPAERVDAWTAQAAQARPAPDRPWVSGSMMWRGRADRAYRPFHQWEVRIATPVAVRGLTVRVRALDTDLKVMVHGESPWLSVGDLAAGATAAASLKLNSSGPAMYAVDLRWDGGEATYQARDKDLPQAADAAGDAPNLAILSPAFDRKAQGGVATVEFMLRNTGGGAATGISATIAFLDRDGKVVATHRHVRKEPLAAGAGANEKAVARNIPVFANVRITARCAEDGDRAAGRLTAAAELQVGRLRLDGTTLRAAVRNGLAEPVAGLAVELELASTDGKPLRTVALPKIDLAAGEVREVAVEVGKLAPWAAFSASFAY
ncbi:MAG: hypothetical protein RLZZ127_1919, partial [Planctomycetota bacterium]